MRAINCFISGSIPIGCSFCTSTNLQCAIGYRFHIKGIDSAINISFIALRNQISQRDFNWAILITSSNRCGKASERWRVISAGNGDRKVASTNTILTSINCDGIGQGKNLAFT